MNEILEWIKINYPTIGWTILVLSIFIQITPIKINPWTPLLKGLGKLMTNDACAKMDEIKGSISIIENNMKILEGNIKTLENMVKENEKDRIRWEILDFANSCRNERKHTRDEFQHIVTLNEKYKDLLKETNDSNGVFEVEFKYIKNIYAEKLEKNDFLA